jgi:hypothetical protein
MTTKKQRASYRASCVLHACFMRASPCFICVAHHPVLPIGMCHGYTSRYGIGPRCPCCCSRAACARSHRKRKIRMSVHATNPTVHSPRSPSPACATPQQVVQAQPWSRDRGRSAPSARTTTPWLDTLLPYSFEDKTSRHDMFRTRAQDASISWSTLKRAKEALRAIAAKSRATLPVAGRGSCPANDQRRSSIPTMSPLGFFGFLAKFHDLLLEGDQSLTGRSPRSSRRPCFIEPLREGVMFTLI